MVKKLCKNLPLLTVVITLRLAYSSNAAWFDSAWTCRRSITIVWDDQAASGQELASVIFYTDGHALPNGEDVRVATEEGKLVASHVLTAGPGDRIRVVFALVKGVRNYCIYFGNPSPAAPPPGMDDVKYKSGLLLETRVWTGGQISNFDQMEKSWERSKPVLGKMMTDGVFLGYNPFGPQDQWISKFSGALSVLKDGDYYFAMAADDVGTLYIDNKPVIFAPLGPGDTRYHATVTLTRGSHDLTVYHVNMAGQAYISLGWKPPDMTKVEVIQKDAFGICYGGLVGPLEIHNKSLIAQMSINQQAECFFNDSYSLHYKFSGKASIAQATKFHWDFGDGQSSNTAEADHIYLVDGIYNVKLTAHVGENSDTQSCKLAVSRNYAHIMDVREDQPDLLAAIVHSYDLNTIPNEQLPRLIELYLAANQPDSAVPAAEKLASQENHIDNVKALAALTLLERKLIDTMKPEQAMGIWDHAPADTDMQPLAARHGAELAVWWAGDFAKAVKFLKPFAEQNDPGLRRQYAQALVLAGQVDAGKKILETEPAQVSANRKAALSGAAARSVEFFITTGDAESGEEAWDKWQAKFPTDFLEGYSVLLRTRLMEMRKRPDAAAKLAEAFATAEPQSPYAPQLLDRASKLLASADPPKSQALHQLLKKKYPEDPLSQN